MKALLLKTLGKVFRNLKFSVYFHWLHFFICYLAVYEQLWPLLWGQPHWPNVCHCVLSIFNPKVAGNLGTRSRSHAQLHMNLFKSQVRYIFAVLNLQESSFETRRNIFCHFNCFFRSWCVQILMCSLRITKKWPN